VTVGSVGPSYRNVAPDTLGQLRRINAAGIELDVDGLAVRVSGQPLPLPPKEFHLLHCLMARRGEVSTLEQLLLAGWGRTHGVGSHALKIHIYRLRTRLAEHGVPMDTIRTVRGEGYLFDDHDGTNDAAAAAQQTVAEAAVTGEPGTQELRLLSVSGVQLGLDGFQLRAGTARVELNPVECRLLAVLMQQAGRVLPHAELIDAVWDGQRVHRAVLKDNIGRVRQRLEEVGAPPELLRTVRNVGYVFDVVDG
jgi:DNA-binding response OmpR family regulator